MYSAIVICLVIIPETTVYTVQYIIKKNNNLRMRLTIIRGGIITSNGFGLWTRKAGNVPIIVMSG